MSSENLDMVIIENGKRREYLLLPDKNGVGDWAPIISALGRLVFDQFVEINKNGGVVSVKPGIIFNIMEISF